ncbi:hypothetical protein P3T76_003314 [Phytophthora citrophthora]|uniref:RxLR effector protein n=1 Tax=Phytophthora citrophthora TaxID=4793 RepID=A0AAD9LQL2_9STRA|nr:hypothetical protein P3T76_003314 [Phytophthora citrophthora]
MRVASLVFLAAVTLLASSEVACATPSALAKPDAINAVSIDDTSSLRNLRKKTEVVAYDAEDRAAEEELVDVKLLDKVISDHKYAKQVFVSWLQNGQTSQDIENRLKTLGVQDKYGKVVTQYAQYLTLLEERSA